MNQFLKVYDVTLQVRGPVFIGSGQDFNKKEYIFLPKSREVLIPDLSKMYTFLKQKGIAQRYEKFMMTDNKSSLSDWMRQQRIAESEMNGWMKYRLDCGDAIWERGRQMQIMSFVKDAYGFPYIPGSSLKGLLRTILLTYDICNNPSDYNDAKRDILRNVDRRAKRTQYLKRENKKVEEIAFNTVDRTRTKSDMVNDIMAGMIVSDSNPLSVGDLTLCQKIEYHIDGTEKRLNLLRECLKPETEVHFTISIDESVCAIEIEDIVKAVKNFSKQYYMFFSGKFPHVDKPADDTVWLGGGTGYASKTVIYSLFGGRGNRIIPKIFQNTNVPKMHGHSKDEQLGVSPHILKKTRYGGVAYQFGECGISFERVE